MSTPNPHNTGSRTPMVSVVIPMRNEEDHVERCVLSLLDQTYPADCYELIVVDGNSADRSRQIVERLQQSHAKLRLLDNPAGIVPKSMNLAIRNSVGEIIVRADAHNVYPPDYVESCIKFLEQTGADNVGGPWRTVAGGETFGARLVVAVLSSPFGVGNSQFRISSHEGYVDTVPFGTFRRNLFDRVGFFNEHLVRNQDNELNARIRKAGGKIYLTPALTTNYFAPATFGKLLRQTYRNTKWHFFTLRQMRNALGIRHLLPAGFVLGLILVVLLAFADTHGRFALAATLLFYFLVASTFAIRTDAPVSVKLALPFAFFAFHICYGAGTVAGVRFVVDNPSVAPIR
jgi:glycosyltransferase involved in cell wall biosynthesis